MLISFLICTYNRSNYLSGTLSSILKIVNNYDVEVIIVDNNSTDNTSEIVDSFIAQFKNNKIIYFKETKQGLSNARNRALKIANGDVVMFIDDDVLLDVGYIENVYKEFSSNDSKIIAGKILLKFEDEKPKWLTSDLENYLSKLDLGNEYRELKIPNEWIVGANMLFSRNVLPLVQFNPNLGRSKMNLISGEEILLMNFLIKKGYKVYYHPEILLYHIIPKSRLNKKFFLKRAFWGGYSNMLISYYESNFSIYIVLKNTLRFLFNLLQWILFFPSNSSFSYLVKLAESLGVFYFTFSKKT